MRHTILLLICLSASQYFYAQTGFDCNRTIDSKATVCDLSLNCRALELLEQKNQTGAFSFIVIGDTQMTDCHLEMFDDLKKRFRNEDFKILPSFVFNIGDALPKSGWNTDRYIAYYELVNSFMDDPSLGGTGVSWFTAAGNHEFDYEGSYGANETFADCIGPRDFMFDFAGNRFFTVNNVQRSGGYLGPGEEETFQISRKQLSLAENWLSNAPGGNIFSFVHAGLAAFNYTCRSPDSHRRYMEYYNLLLKYDVLANFHGHIHHYHREGCI